MKREAVERQAKTYLLRFGRYQVRLLFPRTSYTPSIIFIFAAVSIIVMSFLTLSEPVLIDQEGRYILGDDSVASQQSLNIYRYLALIFFLLAIVRKPVLAAQALNQSIRRRKSTSAAYFFLICAIFANSILQGSVSALINSAILFVYSITFLILFSASELDRSIFYRLLGMVFFSYIVISFFYYWPPNNRWMGGIHPNIYSEVLIFFVAILLFMKQGLRFVGVPLVLFMVLSVDSRYALLSIILILGLFVYFRFLAKVELPATVLAVGIVLPLLTIAMLEVPLVRDVLQLEDIDRGIGSGGTGRLDMIRNNFLPQLESRPLSGFGFRQQLEYYTTHNAYLNIVLENGVIIGTLLIIFILAKYVRLAFMVASNRTLTGFSLSEERLVFSIYTAVLFSGFFMPQIINFGDAFGVFVIFCLAYPLADRADDRCKNR